MTRTRRPMLICARILLGNTKVHVDWTERLQKDDRITGREVLSEIDLPDSQDARERRANHLALDRGLHFAQLCVGVTLIGDRTIEFGLRDHALIEKALHPVELQARKVALGLDRRQLRALLARVEPHEQRSLANGLPGGEPDLSDRAGQVRADRHALDRGHRADRLQRRWPLLRLSHDRGDGFRRRLERCPFRDRGLDLSELHETENRDEPCGDGQHHNHSLCHNSL